MLFQLRMAHAAVLVGVPKFLGILAEQVFEHGAYVGGRILYMAAYQRVAVAQEHQLIPRHVHGHEGRTTPLTRLEHDDAHGSPGAAVVFHHLQHAPLTGVEAEGALAARRLVEDAHAAPRPVLEIVAYAQPFPGRGAEARRIVGIARHGHGHEGARQVGQRRGHLRALPAAAFARARVIGAALRQKSQAPAVFSKQFCVFHH